MRLGPNEPLAEASVAAIRSGDVEALRRLLAANEGLATARIADSELLEAGRISRTLLHVATDWPGHFPDGAAIVGTLVEAGAQVDARNDPGTETPLHWAASSNDVAALDALLDAGAGIEAPGAVIAGGTPLDDAVAFAQWQAARRLVERGARTQLRHAAALGLTDRIESDFAATAPSPDDVTVAFWYACHGGQQQAARALLERGAELNWISVWDGLTPLDASVREGNDELADWLRSVGAQPAELG